MTEEDKQVMRQTVRTHMRIHDAAVISLPGGCDLDTVYDWLTDEYPQYEVSVDCHKDLVLTPAT